jgi:hypothetical protein
MRNQLQIEGVRLFQGYLIPHKSDVADFRSTARARRRVGQVLKAVRVLDDRADGGGAGLGQAVRAQCDGTDPGRRAWRSGTRSAGRRPQPGAELADLHLPQPRGRDLRVPAALRKGRRFRVLREPGAARPSAQRREFSQVRKRKVRRAGFEPATRCLEGMSCNTRCYLAKAPVAKRLLKS